MIETIERWFNKVRIWYLSIFTDRVKHIDIKDNAGKRHRVTAVREEETVCDHKMLRQVHHILWKCNNAMCEAQAYFFIPQKIVVLKPELYTFLDDVAEHLGEELHEKNTA